MRNKARLLLSFNSALILILLVTALLIGCAPAQPSAPTPSPSPSSTPAPAKESHKWKVQSIFPPGLETYKTVFIKWCDMVKEATDGQVTIEPFPGGGLVPNTEVFRALSDGLIDGTNSVGQYYIGVWQGFGVEDSMPMAHSSAIDQADFLLGNFEWKTPYLDFIRPFYEKYGIYYLIPQAAGLNELITKKPVRTISDLNGLKVRTTGLFAKYYAKMGVTAVSTPVAEVYTALSTGTVDGVTTGTEGHYAMKTYEVAKYMSWPPANGMTMHQAINLKAWNKLSPGLKKLVTSASFNFMEWQNRVFWPASNYALVEKMKQNGLETVDFAEIDKARAIAMEVWDDVAKADADTAKAVQMLKAFMKTKGYLK